MELTKLRISIRKGETVAIPLRIATSNLIYKSITAITRSAPVSITVPSHGATDGWPGAVIDVVGMREINAENNPPVNSDFNPITVVDSNTVQFNGISSASFRAYASGGYLVYYEPLDLAMYSSARMSVKSSVDDDLEFLSFTTANSRLELDASTQTLWIRMTAEDGAEITQESGVFDIELVNASGDVKAVCSAYSEITFLPEVTT